MSTAVPGTVADVLARTREALGRRSIDVFAVIDHAAAARAVGLELADEVVIIFGNPAVGTGLMQADPAIGIELPLRLLIRDEAGTTRVSFIDPRSWTASYPQAPAAVLDKLHAVLDSLVTELT